MPDWSLLITGGFVLIFLGFLLVLIAILGSALAQGSKEGNEKNVRVEGGGIIFIGPVPIVFGSDKRSAIMIMLLAIVIMLLLIILMK